MYGIISVGPGVGWGHVTGRAARTVTPHDRYPTFVSTNQNPATGSRGGFGIADRIHRMGLCRLRLIDRADALDGGRARRLDDQVLVGAHPQLAAHRLQELARVRQVVRAARRVVADLA